MITYKQGNLFDSDCQTLVCTVNCEGVMGKGIALEFKKKFPDMFSAYRTVCLYGQTQLRQGGDVWLYCYPDAGRQSRILCFATKGYWRNPSRLEWIERGLQKVKSFITTYNITSIAFPKLGCTNGGLDWMDVKPLMEKYLNKLDIPVEIYV